MDLLGKLVEVGTKHAEHQGEFTVKGLGEKARGVYGFSIRTGIGGEGAARVEPFDNVHASKRASRRRGARAVVNVFDEGGEVVLTAERPGAREEEVTAELRGNVLTIESHGERHYAKEILLPSAIDGKACRRNITMACWKSARARSERESARTQTTGQRVVGRHSPDRGDVERLAEGKR